jgi:hypothetical protein
MKLNISTNSSPKRGDKRVKEGSEFDQNTLYAFIDIYNETLYIINIH